MIQETRKFLTDSYSFAFSVVSLGQATHSPVDPFMVLQKAQITKISSSSQVLQPFKVKQRALEKLKIWHLGKNNNELEDKAKWWNKSNVYGVEGIKKYKYERMEKHVKAPIRDTQLIELQNETDHSGKKTIIEK